MFNGVVGTYEGAAHTSCRDSLKHIPNQTKVQVVFHNLRGYDGHIFMSSIGVSNNEGCKFKC